MSQVNRERLLEISGRIRDHLTQQHAAAVNDDGNCMYRAAGGARCAVGCLITDDAYHEGMEENTVDTDVVWFAVSKSLQLDGETSATCERLSEILVQWQLYHDGLGLLGRDTVGYPGWVADVSDCSPSVFEQDHIIKMIEAEEEE